MYKLSTIALQILEQLPLKYLEKKKGGKNKVIFRFFEPSLLSWHQWVGSITIQCEWHLFSFPFFFFFIYCFVFNFCPSFFVGSSPFSIQTNRHHKGWWVVDGTFEGLGRRMLWSEWWSFESSYIFATLNDCNLCCVCYQNCKQKDKGQDLADKSQVMENKIKKLLKCILIHALEWLELLAYMKCRKQQFKEYSVDSQIPSSRKQDLVWHWCPNMHAIQFKLTHILKIFAWISSAWISLIDNYFPVHVIKWLLI